MLNVGDRQRYFSCDECPVLEGLEHRLNLAKEFGEFQYDYCWCDKTGGKLWNYGYCEDGWSDIPNARTGRSKTTGRARRRELTRKKLKKQRDSLSTYCRWGDGLSDYDNPESAYIRHRHRSGRTTYFKQFSNRKIRREKEFSGNGNAYRRVFDYWWNVI